MRYDGRMKIIAEILAGMELTGRERIASTADALRPAPPQLAAQRGGLRLGHGPRAVRALLRAGVVAGAAGAAALLAACVYRMPIRQGNYLDPTAVAQVKPGMTHSQVRYLLGTPMVPGGFDNARWDYDYYLNDQPPAQDRSART